MYVFSNLVVRRTNAGDAVSIRVVKETADYFGWSEAFEDYTKSRKAFMGDRYNAFCPSLGKGARQGGRGCQNGAGQGACESESDRTRRLEEGATRRCS